MKKVLFIAVLVIGSIFSANAQGGFNVGVNFALPVGDAGDVSSFSIGLDLNYLFEVSELFDAGIATGYTHAIGKGEEFGIIIIENPDIDFIPFAGAARFNVSEDFVLGADIGYAIGLTDGIDGGFYYRPLIGYNITDSIQINASYTGISLDGATWSTIGIGATYGF